MVRIPRIAIDPYVVLLMATVAVASLLPCRGQGAIVFGLLTDIAIVLLFFLHGAKLSREEIRAGVGHWRLHIVVLMATFLLFPLLGLMFSKLAVALGMAGIAPGMLYLTLLPSTVQSSIAFTALAGGNVAAAVCSASLSNVLGIFLTPGLVALFMDGAGIGAGVSGQAVQKIVAQLLLPFVIGHLCRPLVIGIIQRHKPLVTTVDRGSILLVVYTAFSAAVVEGLWRRIGLDELAFAFVGSCVILGLVMTTTLFAARRLGFSRADEIVILFCGSKKSLASGVPMAGAIFPAAAVGSIILPLMIFHQIQLVVCAIVAAAYRRSAPAAA